MIWIAALALVVFVAIAFFIAGISRALHEITKILRNLNVNLLMNPDLVDLLSNFTRRRTRKKDTSFTA